MSRGSERGAVAVEFALLVPILIMILLGIMEFGRAYNVQASLTNAAREGARSVAISTIEADAITATKNAAPTLNPQLNSTDVTFKYAAIPATTPSPTACSAGRQVTVTVSYNLSTVTGIAGPFAMTGTGTMLCGG
jgi:Flp pilus assembly protein TadG